MMSFALEQGYVILMNNAGQGYMVDSRDEFEQCKIYTNPFTIVFTTTQRDNAWHDSKKLWKYYQ
jgi:hypothetical protein